MACELEGAGAVTIVTTFESSWWSLICGSPVHATLVKYGGTLRIWGSTRVTLDSTTNNIISIYLSIASALWLAFFMILSFILIKGRAFVLKIVGEAIRSSWACGTSISLADKPFTIWLVFVTLLSIPTCRASSLCLVSCESQSATTNFNFSWTRWVYTASFPRPSTADNLASLCAACPTWCCWRSVTFSFCHAFLADNIDTQD